MSTSGGTRRSSSGGAGGGQITPSMPREAFTAQQDALFDTRNRAEGGRETAERVSAELGARLENNPAFMAYSRARDDLSAQETVYTLMRAWGTGVGHGDTVAALQEAAAREFGLRGAAPVSYVVRDPTDHAHMAGLQAFVRAQYDHTQQWLASNGIKSMQLYRMMNWNKNEASPAGVAFRPGERVEHTATLSMRGLAGFSADYHEVAVHTGARSLLVGGRVPSSRIFSLGQTGLGTKGEAEVVILGGTDTWAVESNFNPNAIY